MQLQELAVVPAGRNRAVGRPGTTEDILLGMGVYADLIQQLTYPDKAYNQINLMVKQRWVIIHKEDTSVQFFLHIRGVMRALCSDSSGGCLQLGTSFMQPKLLHFSWLLRLT